MFTQEQITQLKELNDRLQSGGFSWQHSDYFLLQNMLPSILSVLNADIEGRCVCMIGSQTCGKFDSGKCIA